MAKKESNLALLLRVTRLMAKPRVTKSVREQGTKKAGRGCPKWNRSSSMAYPVRMKKTPSVPPFILAVPCPTYGVAPGKFCVLWLGGHRTEPHANRKDAASEAAVEMKQITKPW